MNRVKIWLITALLIPILILTSCNSALTPKALASDTQQIVEQVKGDNNAVFTEIQRNIDLVAELKTKVQDAKASGKPLSLNSIINDIQTIAESYEKLAGQKDNIRKNFLLKIRTIENKQREVSSCLLCSPLKWLVDTQRWFTDGMFHRIQSRILRSSSWVSLSYGGLKP